MTADIDHILDRRGLRRKVSFWRIAALILLVAALLAALAAAGVFKEFGKPRSHIARITISGMITENRKLLKLIEKARKDKGVKGVVVAINSPGGTVVGGETIYNAIRKLAKDKPTVASVGSLATSAGYMIAAASDHIVAHHSSIVGSIGVIFQYPQASQLLDKIGVQMKEVKSSPLKAEPSPFHPAPPESIVVLQRVIDDSYNWFVDLVTERRGMPRSEVLKIANGTIYSGSQGKKIKLIDRLGGEEEAKEWLVEKGVNKDLKVVDWKVPATGAGLLFSSSLNRWLFSDKATGLKGLDPDDLPAFVPRRLFLDGLLSVWHG